MEKRQYLKNLFEQQIPVVVTGSCVGVHDNEYSIILQNNTNITKYCMIASNLFLKIITLQI